MVVFTKAKFGRIWAPTLAVVVGTAFLAGLKTLVMPLVRPWTPWAPIWAWPRRAIFNASSHYARDGSSPIFISFIIDSRIL